MKLILILALLGLAGCASTHEQNWLPSNQSQSLDNWMQAHP